MHPELKFERCGVWEEKCKLGSSQPDSAGFVAELLHISLLHWWKNYCRVSSLCRPFGASCFPRSSPGQLCLILLKTTPVVETGWASC